MTDHLLQPLAAGTRDSEFLQTLRSVRRDGGLAFALGPSPVRPLTDDEQWTLESNGNTAEDWTRIRVTPGFRPDRITHSEFRGTVVVGRFIDRARGPGGVEFPSGVHRSTVSNCVIGHGAVVRNVGLIEWYVVGERAWVSDCGRVVCDPPTTFGNGTTIPIGPQCGGRDLRTFAELTLDLAEAMTSRGCRDGLAGWYAELFDRYLEQVRAGRGVIGPAAVVAHVPVVRNAYVGPAAELDAATRVEDSTLLSRPGEPVRVTDGACVVGGLFQWGARVAGPAVVERAVLLEHATVERFGKVVDSVIGPNSTIGGAEVTGSLIGPFVNCHHQGMLIAARWPAGRGNLSYGAGVGCNHTSRAPDQEAFLGEGIFVGLGVKIQYPVDLTNSPYTVLATGVTLPPQKLRFPFSLVRAATEPIPGLPPGGNVLVPGWMLAENLYAVQRAALKYRTRDRATRHRFRHDVFRSDVMALVADACRRLEEVAGRHETYTEREVPGLGRNVMSERHRAAAVACYREHLDRWTLLRLLVRAEDALAERADPGDAVRESFATGGWDAGEGLERLAELLDRFGTAVEQSKARDEERGPLVIDDYSSVHAPTKDDSVVRQTWEEVWRAQARVARVSVALHSAAAAATPVRVVPIAGG
jgi:hypothetical protein